MTYDQLESIAVQAMHQITERLYILDMYTEPTQAEMKEFVESIRGKVESFNAAWTKYQKDGS